MALDTSYEFWVKDVTTGEDICVATGLSKDVVKNMKKERGLKNFNFFDV